jgi:tripeptidyl-peptidase-1
MHVRAFFALLGVASASVMDSLTGIPDGWKSLGNAPADQKIHLRIAMSARHPELLEQTLYDISDPSSPRYGRYLKRDELKSMMRPHSEATTAVFRWLSQSGVHLDAIAEDGKPLVDSRSNVDGERADTLKGSGSILLLLSL